MLNITISLIVVFVVIPIVLFVGYEFVPEVKGGSGTVFSNEFLFNGYLIILGFLLTSAAIGPIVAKFVEWRTNKEWAFARRNARNRLAQSLNDFLRAYKAFLVSMDSNETYQFAPMFLDQTLAGLADFFDAYTDEHVTFNAGMHSAASNIRIALLPLQRSLNATKLCANRNRSYRAYFHQDALNKFRALIDLSPYAEGSILTTDSYLSKYGKLFVDLQIDQQLGVGSITMYRFTPLNMEIIRAQWAGFCKSCEMPTGEDGSIQDEFQHNSLEQARLHAKFVHSQVEEQYVAEALIKND